MLPPLLEPELRMEPPRERFILVDRERLLKLLLLRLPEERMLLELRLLPLITLRFPLLERELLIFEPERLLRLLDRLALAWFIRLATSDLLYDDLLLFIELRLDRELTARRFAEELVPPIARPR